MMRKNTILASLAAASAVGAVLGGLLVTTAAAEEQAATEQEAAQQEAATAAPAAPADTSSDMRLEGEADGTVFRTLTITGEDRISIEFERPELSVDLDPRTAPGLEWGDPLAVLRRDGVDLAGPFLAASAAIPSRGFADDWVSIFRDDGVARFRPTLEDVDSWRLTVVDSRSDTVAVFEGRGEPRREIAWSGLRRDGRPAAPGLVYSYVLEASDKAGNRRSFPGEGFELPPYRVEDDEGMVHLFSARSLPAGWAARPAGVPPALLLEVASRINRGAAEAPVEVRVGARSFAEASGLADAVAGVLRERTLGDPTRIRVVTDVRPDAPEGGTVAVVAGPGGKSS